MTSDVESPVAVPDEARVLHDEVVGLCEEVAARMAALAAGSPVIPAPLRAVEGGRLHRLGDDFGLGPVATGLVAVAATAMLDGRFGALFSGLDPGRARPNPRVDVALAVAGGSLLDLDDRALVNRDSVLRRAGLIVTLDEADPLPDRVVATSERVVGHLLGSAACDQSLVALLAPGAPIDHPAVLDIARAVLTGQWIVWLRDADGSGRSVAATGLGAADVPAVVLDLDRLGPGQTLHDVLPAAMCEAGLVAGAVVVGPVDPQRDREALRQLVLPPARPLILVSAASWDPTLSGALPVLLESPRLDVALRRPAWDRLATELAIPNPGTAAAELALLRVAPDRVESVGTMASGLAMAKGESVDISHLRSAALAQGMGRLKDVARHVVPSATFDDLILPPDLTHELHAMSDRYRTRHIVRAEWGLDRRSLRGIACLFSGPSGTGKTLASEVVAHELGVDLFVINLSHIVDKYIGETEKKLERVFNAAERINGVLLFDEADALFGKRGNVGGANDRYANVEVAYLLQRMERHEGIVILTTNLRNNIDEAFLRRLDVICAFPEPGPEERLALWRLHLPVTVPQDDDLDLPALAHALPISGGIIRNIALTAAHVAASGAGIVTRQILIAACRREYAKLGRLMGDI